MSLRTVLKTIQDFEPNANHRETLVKTLVHPLTVFVSLCVPGSGEGARRPGKRLVRHRDSRPVRSRLVPSAAAAAAAASAACIQTVSTRGDSNRPPDRASLSKFAAHWSPRAPVVW